MKALVVYGSKNGSTREIAEKVRATLTDERFETRMMNAKEAIDAVDQYDLIVIGSPLYMATWLKECTEFVRKNHVVLKSRPVWLFSSGLKFEDPRSLSPKVLTEFAGTIDIRGHQFFPGSLEPEKLGLVHRFVLRIPGIRSIFPMGDFRNWAEIESWARRAARSFPSSDDEWEGAQQSSPVPEEVARAEGGRPSIG